MKCTVPPPTSRPYISAGCLTALSFGVLRKVVGCFLRIVGQQVLREVTVLVVGKLIRLQPWALFQRDYAEAILRQFTRQHATRGAAADDNEIYRLARLVMALCRRGAHDFTSSACAS